LDISNSFGINAPEVITSLYPNGTETHIEGNDLEINWNAQTGHHINISYNTLYNGVWDDDKETVIVSNTSNDGSYVWTPDIISDNVFIKVAVYDDQDNLIAYKISESNFAIQSSDDISQLTLYTPNGGENFRRGGRVPIAWSVEGGHPDDEILIFMLRNNNSELSYGKNVYLFYSNENPTVNDWSETVTIPDGIDLATDWYFCVKHKESNVVDCSDSSFEISSLVTQENISSWPDDVNSNGKIDIKDVIMSLQILSGIKQQ
jgi:hypothetical protein